MDSTRRISIATGALFVSATVAAVAAAALLPGGLTGSDYLTGVAGHPSRMAASALLYLIAAGTSVGIAIALYPLLKKTNAGLAVGALVFRTVEAAFYAAAVVSLMSLTDLGQQFATAPATDRAPIQAMADYVLGARDHSTLAAVFAFSVGTFMYSVVFYRSRLVPRWLAAWGVTGAALIGTGCVMSLFSNAPITGYSLLFLPVALWEMVLALWLLVKGFQTEITDIDTPTTSTTAPRRRTSQPA
jgi:hypothetical protein